jgi:hydrogenase maturation protease
MTDEKRCKILVLGIGNILLRDEGVGVRVIERLQQMDLPSSVEVVDGGTSGADLLDVLSEREKVIVVDAIDTGGTDYADMQPGETIRLEADQLAPPDTPDISLHDLGIGETIQMTKMLNCAPDSVVIIGVKPKDLTPGLELSSTIEQVIPMIIKQVLKDIPAE